MFQFVTNMKLRNSILLGFSIPMLLLIIIPIVTYLNVRQVAQQAESVEAAHIIVYKIKDLEIAVNEMLRAERGYIINPNEQSIASYDRGHQDFLALQDELVQLVKDEQAQQTLAKIFETGKFVDEYCRKLISWMSEGRRQDVLDDWAKGIGRDAARDLRELIQEFEDREAEVRDQRMAAETAALNALAEIVIFGSILALVVVIFVSLGFSAAIGKKVREAASKLSSASAEIASTIEQQERTTNQQSASVNQTTSTMEELSASSRQSAEQTESASNESQQVLSQAEQGVSEVEQASQAMTDLKDNVGAIAEQILRLSEQISQIGDITNLVSDIANQTNLLALNAAVEAARAGEHGKGFAVVASEIRKLADESKKSAERINVLVTDIQKATNSTVMVTEEGTKTVDRVQTISRQNAESFRRISSSAEVASSNIQQVTLNVQQQADAVRQVVEAMNAINAGAKETAAGIKQTKLGVQGINQAAEELAKMAN